MAAVLREVDDSLATLLAVLYCLNRQMQIVAAWQQNYYWSLFRKFGMYYEFVDISYKMIIRHISRWMNRVLKVLNVSCFR
jgi:hypothetical protein